MKSAIILAFLGLTTAAPFAPGMDSNEDQGKENYHPHSSEYYGQYFVPDKYYFKNGLSYENALYGLEELNKAHQYARAAMKTVGRSDAPKEVKYYIMQQLELGFNFFEGFHKMHMTLSSYKTDYVPYVFTQYAYKEIEEAYHYFQKLYQYVQKQEGTGYWKKAVLFIYLTTEKAYNIFKEGVSEDFHFQKYTEDESKQYPSYWYLQVESDIKPYNFEFYDLENSLAYRNGPYRSLWKSEEPYQYGYYGFHKNWESNKPYKTHDVSPYGYKYFGNSQIAPVV